MLGSRSVPQKYVKKFVTFSKHWVKAKEEEKVGEGQSGAFLLGSFRIRPRVPAEATGCSFRGLDMPTHHRVA